MRSASSITPVRIARLRMQALGLVRPAGILPQLETPLEVVQWQLATQSQDWGASRWAIGSRLPAGAQDADVLDACDTGQIVRSWSQRGTVHALAAADLRWMLDLTGVRALAGLSRRWQALGIDEAFLERARDIAIQLLHGGRSCSRSEDPRPARARSHLRTCRARSPLPHVTWPGGPRGPRMVDRTDAGRLQAGDRGERRGARRARLR